MTQQAVGPELLSAIIAAAVAVIVAVVSVITQVVLWFMDKRAQREHEQLQHRRAALLSALQVIDHVYANSPLDGKPASHPHDWPLSLARDAMNGMIVFCENPDKTIAAFSRAIGLHNPTTGGAPTFGPADLDAFRKVVCEELKVKAPPYSNTDMTWISGLSGGK